MRFVNGIGAVVLVLALGGCVAGEAPSEPTGDTLFVKRLEESHIDISEANLNENIDVARRYCETLPTVPVADDQKFAVLASYVAAISQTGSSVANKTGSEAYVKASVGAYCPELGALVPTDDNLFLRVDPGSLLPELGSLVPTDDNLSLSGDDLFVPLMRLGNIGVSLVLRRSTVRRREQIAIS